MAARYSFRVKPPVLKQSKRVGILFSFSFIRHIRAEVNWHISTRQPLACNLLMKVDFMKSWSRKNWSRGSWSCGSWSCESWSNESWSGVHTPDHLPLPNPPPHPLLPFPLNPSPLFLHLPSTHLKVSNTRADNLDSVEPQVKCLERCQIIDNIRNVLELVVT